MPGFDVEQTELPATRAYVISVHDEMQAGVGDMTATMTNLLDGGWSGQAATAFRAGWDEWLGGAQQVLRALDAAAAALAATATQYADQDGLSAATMARLNGALG